MRNSDLFDQTNTVILAVLEAMYGVFDESQTSCVEYKRLYAMLDAVTGPTQSIRVLAGNMADDGVLLIRGKHSIKFVHFVEKYEFVVDLNPYGAEFYTLVDGRMDMLGTSCFESPGYGDFDPHNIEVINIVWGQMKPQPLADDEELPF